MPVRSFHTINGKIRGMTQNSTSVPLRTTYFHDALGNVVATTNQYGVAKPAVRYSDWGATVFDNGGWGALSFGWVGGWGYRALGPVYSDIYVPPTHYSSTQGRWTSVNPVWPDLSQYGYASARLASPVVPSALGEPLAVTISQVLPAFQCCEADVPIGGQFKYRAYRDQQFICTIDMPRGDIRTCDIQNWLKGYISINGIKKPIGRHTPASYSNFEYEGSVLCPPFKSFFGGSKYSGSGQDAPGLYMGGGGPCESPSSYAETKTDNLPANMDFVYELTASIYTCCGCPPKLVPGSASCTLWTVSIKITVDEQGVATCQYPGKCL